MPLGSLLSPNAMGSFASAPVVCAIPPDVYEGDDDFVFDCTPEGAQAGAALRWEWAPRAPTTDLAALVGTDGGTPTFLVPSTVEASTKYRYTVTVSAEGHESAVGEVTVTVLKELTFEYTVADQIYRVKESDVNLLLPIAVGGIEPHTYMLTPTPPRGLALDANSRMLQGVPTEITARTEFAWSVLDAWGQRATTGFFIEVLAKDAVTEGATPPQLSITLSAVNFGVQAAGKVVSLDAVTEQISAKIAGRSHVGRLFLSSDEPVEVRAELHTPVTLKRSDDSYTHDAASDIVLEPEWALSESCALLSSSELAGAYVETTLSRDDCKVLHFGGRIALQNVSAGLYEGIIEVILAIGPDRQTHHVPVEVTLVPARSVPTIGPEGVRFGLGEAATDGLTSQQNIGIYPNLVLLTPELSEGVLELSNPSIIPLEVTLSTRFGYTESTPGEGLDRVIDDTTGSPLGDLSAIVSVHPHMLVIMPGETGHVRYAITDDENLRLGEKGYAGIFSVTTKPRQFVREDRMPERTDSSRIAQIVTQVQGVYVPGLREGRLQAHLESVSGNVVTLLLETQDHPFVGGVSVHGASDEELGRADVLVYTRSRVRIPLRAGPLSAELSVHFHSRGEEKSPPAQVVSLRP